MLPSLSQLLILFFPSLNRSPSAWALPTSVNHCARTFSKKFSPSPTFATRGYRTDAGRSLLPSSISRNSSRPSLSLLSPSFFTVKQGLAPPPPLLPPGPVDQQFFPRLFQVIKDMSRTPSSNSYSNFRHPPLLPFLIRTSLVFSHECAKACRPTFLFRDSSSLTR